MTDIRTSASSTSSRPSEFRDSIMTPVQFIKGVGPFRAEILKKLKIETVEDVLFYFPRDHQDRRLRPINSASAGQKMAFRGQVQFIEIRQVGRQLGQARAVLKDATGTIEAIWFKFLSYKYDPFSGVRRDVVLGREIFVYGLIEPGPHGPVLKVDDYDVADGVETLPLWNGIVPIYPLTEGIGDKWLRQLVERVVRQEAHNVKDSLPKALREAHSLLSLPEAVRHYHFPADWKLRDKARERLAFDEFFHLELAMEVSRQDRQTNSKGFQFLPTKKLLTPFKNQLQYDFTKAQTRAINEIFRDMGKTSPMYRLLQGDVGSGKTVVALSAALLAIENGRQAALLAPTEILAEQHALTIEKFFNDLPVQSALLTGSTPAPEKKKILERLKSGKINFLVGTHAILNESVIFKQLGFVVIDEQHRFGVRQRAKLVNRSSSHKGFEEGRLLDQAHPDVLVMTATPIPRTLALTLYGDLDVSVLDERPPNRVTISTRCVSEADAMEKIRRTVIDGHQAFIVFPLLEESQKISKRTGKPMRSAKQEYERLKTIFPEFKLGLMHGQLKAAEKKSVMDAFRSGEFSVLVSTTVVEVGIDVPNSTLIVIMNPERFGLAQLHQLRGRVGRGAHASECLLVPDEIGEESQERLNIFCALSDGFKLAEEDLKLRGPGEILGDAQHGVPFFKVGNIISDGLLISQARTASSQLIQGTLSLTMLEFAGLNRALQKRFGDSIQLSRVG